MATFIGFLPKDATPVRGRNTTDITDTTVQAILAAPASASQSYYITSISYMNRTEAEIPFVRVQDNAATPLVYDVANLKTPNASTLHLFWPPLRIAAGAALNGMAVTAVGDVEICVNGFLGTP